MFQEKRIVIQMAFNEREQMISTRLANSVVQVALEVGKSEHNESEWSTTGLEVTKIS